MKKLVLIILSLLISSILLYADSTISAKLAICREIEMSLVYQFIQQQKELPTSWSEFDDVNMVKNGLLQYQSFRAKTMNSFALVPGAPNIQSQSGIPQEYSGHRLFLISRNENFTEKSGGGRYAILIKPLETDSQSVQTYSCFIPEVTAQIIMKQIGDFDPQKQPLAFENIDQLERGKKTQQEKSTQEIREDLKEKGKQGPDDPIKSQAQYPRRMNFHEPAWVAGGLILIMFLLWGVRSLYLRCKR